MEKETKHKVIKMAMKQTEIDQIKFDLKYQIIKEIEKSRPEYLHNECENGTAEMCELCWAVQYKQNMVDRIIKIINNI